MSKALNIASAGVIAVGLALSGYFISHGIVKFKLLNRYVTVKGLAEQVVKSNQAVWTLQFSYADNDMSSLYQGVAGAQKNVKTFLINQGFDPNNIQTQPISITDNQGSSYSSNSNAKRFSANTSVVLVTNNIDRVEAAIQKTGDLVESGVILTSSSITYRYTQLNSIKPQMIITATQNARQAAQTFAKNSESHLSGIKYASQGLFTISNADGSYGNQDPMKKVRVVTTLQYYLQ